MTHGYTDPKKFHQLFQRFYIIVTSDMWPLLLAIAVVITSADNTEMLCPGLEPTHLQPQCINDREFILDPNSGDVCPQNSVWEPKSKVCSMCGGCTDYLSEYELILHDTHLHFIVRMGTVIQKYTEIILSSSSSSSSSSTS